MKKPIDRSGLETRCMQMFNSVVTGPHDNESSTGTFNSLYTEFLYNAGGPGEVSLDGGGTLNGIFGHIVVTVENPPDTNWCSDEEKEARSILREMLKDPSPGRQSRFVRFCNLNCLLKDLLFCKQVHTSTTSTSEI
jgi:hypothetical protein